MHGRNQARIAFGGVERYKERSREAMGVRALEDLVQDVRFALRNLGRRPAYTTVIFLTLALGIGATTAIYGLLDAVLLTPLPYYDEGRVVQVLHYWDGKENGHISPAEHFDYERELDGFTAYGAYAFGTVTLQEGADPTRIDAGFLTHGVLRALGAPPALGRGITREEDVGDAPVVLLSHALWTSRFGADPEVVGRTIAASDTTLLVIGVMPPPFELPEDLRRGTRSMMYLPMGLDPANTENRGSHFMEGVARLPDSMTTDQAGSMIEALTAAWVRSYPEDYPDGMGFDGTAVPIRTVVLGDTRPLLFTLLGAVALVLIIAAANVANLQLAAADTRRREFAVRASLGAGRGRIVRQVLAENVLLAIGGGVAGLIVAAVGTELFLALDPPNIPRLDDVRFDARIVTFAFGLSVITGIGFGLIPALDVTRRDLSRSLKEGSRGTTAGSGRLKRTLVIGELAFAIVVLAAAGLFGRSFAELLAVDPGFVPGGVFTARLSVPPSRVPEEDGATEFVRMLSENLSDMPGVRAAGAVSNLPLTGRLGDMNFRIEGRPVPEGQSSPRADWQTATPGYREAAGLQLVAGRWINEGDRSNVEGAVVISETTAATYWPNEDPLGRRFELGGGAGPGWVTIVGIVRDVTHSGLEAEATAQMYIAHHQFRFWGSGRAARVMTFVLRADPGVDPLTLTPSFRQAVREVNPAIAVSDIQTMDAVLSRSVSRPRAMTWLLGVFSALALVLAAIGVYGVMAFSVAERRRELAIRIALGARPGQIVRPVLGQGLAMIAAGAGLGLVGALLMSRALRSLLYAVSPTDPTVLVSVTVVLAAVGLVACWVPALRATRVDPMIPLRAE